PVTMPPDRGARRELGIIDEVAGAGERPCLGDPREPDHALAVVRTDLVQPELVQIAAIEAHRDLLWPRRAGLIIKSTIHQQRIEAGQCVSTALDLER
ncbi:MAG: hypothetical protein ACRDMZ_13245, partial [Solirubrobacteraceae bacterium]